MNNHPSCPNSLVTEEMIEAGLGARDRICIAVLTIVGIGLLLLGDETQGLIAFVGSAACFVIAWKGFGDAR